ncbi:MAG: hypothetical protein U9N87_11090, partial [Planctomycetota bacterium]|nr:hypothetical protein [Planctomycetota bacterium]
MITAGVDEKGWLENGQSDKEGALIAGFIRKWPGKSNIHCFHRHCRQKSAVYVSLSCVSEGRWLVGVIGSRNVCFETRRLGKKLRSLLPLPKGGRDLTVLAHRQRSSRL